jgi:hypothetical protein
MTSKQFQTPHTAHHAAEGEAPKDLDFEAAVRRMRGGDAAARTEAQDIARELARLHHEFMESSQPYFQAAKEN